MWIVNTIFAVLWIWASRWFWESVDYGMYCIYKQKYLDERERCSREVEEKNRWQDIANKEKQQHWLWKRKCDQKGEK